MKSLVWIAGLVLVVALLFPNGVSIPAPPPVVPTPVNPEPVKPVVPTDPDIVRILAPATPAHKARIRGVYSAMATALKRDKEKLLVKNTEQFALWHANTLAVAIDDDARGKYPGLDVAIEAVFTRKLGVKPEAGGVDVVAIDAAARAKLVEAAELIAASAE
jgi:hypothetical protein